MKLKLRNITEVKMSGDTIELDIDTSSGWGDLVERLVSCIMRATGQNIGDELTDIISALSPNYIIVKRKGR